MNLHVSPESALRLIGAEKLEPEGAVRRSVKAAPFIWRDPASIPRRQWLYPRTFVRKFVTGTIAPGGVGKTGLGLVELLAMATGRDLLGDGFSGKPCAAGTGTAKIH